MIKCILFDVYGTLISTGTGSVDAAKRILNNKNAAVMPEEFYFEWKKIHRKNILNQTDFITEKQIFENDLKELFARYGIDGDYKKDVLYMINSLYSRKAYPETKTALKMLGKKYKIVIASTTDTAPLKENLEFNNISVQNIFTSESLRCYKPNIQFYNRILDSVKVNAQEALFVGDSLVDDVRGPQSIGLKTCWINRKNIKNTSGIVPDITADNLLEFCERLKEDDL